MKPDRHAAGAAGIVLAAAALAGLTWFLTLRSTDAQRQATASRIAATLSNQALMFSEQINRQFLAADQTLRLMTTTWQADPAHFELEAARRQAVALDGLSRDMLLTDAHGVIRQSSVADAIGQNVSGLGYFRALADPLAGPLAPPLATPADSSDRMYIGPTTINGIMRQWHMDVARALHAPDGSFAGVIDADFRISALTDVFSQTNLGHGVFITLVGLTDGKLRGAVGPAVIDPDVSITDTPMFAAVSTQDYGVWTGPSAHDAVQRIHAFHRIPDRNLVVVAGMDEAEALAPAHDWKLHADILAAVVTVLLAALAFALSHFILVSRRREALMAQDRATLAAANAQLLAARAQADAKAEQLQATLAGMADGVAMVDAHMCLVEWNARFPEIAGIPPDILRVGLPMEQILRAQVQTGQFGHIPDPEQEVERRMARLRVTPYGVVQRQRPDGRTIELRRKRLPDGGFVTLYSDVTEHKRAEEALRVARTEAEAANTAKSRFVAMVSHEIRTPLNALLNTIRLMADSVLSPAQKSLITVARQSGDVLYALISDILDMSQMEAGKLALRPSLFELRPLLESCVELFATQAEAKGIRLHVDIAPRTPGTLLTDPGRLRQVLLNLLSNAIKYAAGGDVWLTAEPAPGAALRLAVKDAGPVIAPTLREKLFRPFSRLGRPGDNPAAGSGLGLSICHELMGLMKGEIGCDVWQHEGVKGNVFWATLPLAALPFRENAGPMPAGASALLPVPVTASGAAERPVPRTRILVTEDVPANQIVTATLLRREGHLVDISASGEAAIEALRSRPYDLVFMDIFMPGMGGLEATQVIRGMKPPMAEIPVIALTANVSPEDEVTFRAAGMNGLIGKPVSLQAMLDVLRHHVWFPRADDGAVTPVQDAAANEATPILGEDRLAELSATLPPDRLASLVEECLQDLHHRLPALRRALRAAAPSAIAAQAHTMVGMAATFGMLRLEERLRTIMTAAREGDLNALDPASMNRIEQDYEQAAAVLREAALAGVAGSRTGKVAGSRTAEAREAARAEVLR